MLARQRRSAAGGEAALVLLAQGLARVEQRLTGLGLNGRRCGKQGAGQQQAGGEAKMGRTANDQNVKPS